MKIRDRLDAVRNGLRNLQRQILDEKALRKVRQQKKKSKPG